MSVDKVDMLETLLGGKEEYFIVAKENYYSSGRG